MYCCVNCGLPRSEHGIGKPAWCPNGKGQSYYEGGTMAYGTEEHSDKGRTRHGSPFFYALLDKMAETHDRKSHDYASDSNPFGNYHFAGMLSKLFTNPNDAGFIGRIGEKLYRLANLENSRKEVKVVDESVEDTETDIAVIILLWITDRRQRRAARKVSPQEVAGMPAVDIKICNKCKHQELFHNFKGSGKCAFCDCTLGATPTS